MTLLSGHPGSTQAAGFTQRMGPGRPNRFHLGLWVLATVVAWSEAHFALAAWCAVLDVHERSLAGQSLAGQNQCARTNVVSRAQIPVDQEVAGRLCDGCWLSPELERHHAGWLSPMAPFTLKPRPRGPRSTP